MITASGADKTPDDAPDQHIVDVLIEERAHKLRHSRLWPLYKAVLYPILLHQQAVKLTDKIAPLSAKEIFDHVSDLLTIDLKITGIENVPKQGRVLIASTHPTGIPDGIAMYDALKAWRPDMTFFANRDAIRAAPNIEDMIIPVEWVKDKRTRLRSRETLVSAIRAFNSEKCVVLFPSGRLAYMDENKVQTEQEWLQSVAIFARKYNCAIVPTHIKSRNSWMYYWFWRVNTELRDITLFHELLNKKNKPYEVTFGPLIDPDQLQGEPVEVAAALREHAAHEVTAGVPWTPIEQRPVKPTEKR